MIQPWPLDPNTVVMTPQNHPLIQTACELCLTICMDGMLINIQIQRNKDTNTKIGTTFFMDYCVWILVPNFQRDMHSLHHFKLHLCLLQWNLFLNHRFVWTQFFSFSISIFIKENMYRVIRAFKPDTLGVQESWDDYQIAENIGFGGDYRYGSDNFFFVLYNCNYLFNA